MIAAFGKTFSKTGRIPAEFHRYPIEGRDSRNVGDYDILPGLDGNDTREQLARAQDFLSMAEDFFSTTDGRMED